MTTLPINAAFRSSNQDECYLFVKESFVVVNYAPGSTKDDLLNGPVNISSGFRILANTPFAKGIDCAFNTSGTEVVIFSGPLCARIDFAPPYSTAKARMLEGAMQINAMFPMLQGTEFAKGLDAAITITRKEVAIFKGDQFALIDYQSKKLLKKSTLISDAFPRLYGTPFETGIDAAFNSHVKDEAYLFKGKYVARLTRTSNTSNSIIFDGRIWYIPTRWPALSELIEP